MIRYPYLRPGDTIGVTAPSSGVQNELHYILELAIKRLENDGYRIICGQTPWTKDKAKSAPAKVRADEFNQWMADEYINFLIPPWGGELLIEILEYIDFTNMKEKWVLGYSDLSALLLSITLKTGIATAHGTNLVDLRGEYSDVVTDMWRTVLSTKQGDSVLQHSSEKFQEKWQHDNPSPCVFHLTEKTEWKTVSGGTCKIKGRLLGGCIHIIRHLIGTPFGKIQSFRDEHIPGEPVIWYFENSELSTADLRRTLVQMKLAGWFENCAGVMFGRSPANQPIENYTAKDVYHDLALDLQVPIIYDIDCGHVLPQITFINGAFAEVEVKDQKGTVRQFFI